LNFEEERKICLQIAQLPDDMAFYYFKENKEKLSDDMYWLLIRALWIQNGKCTEEWKQLIFNSNRKRNHKIMKSADRQALNKLPKRIKIYRGCKEKSDENKFNWSTDKSFVEKYIKTMQGYYIAEKEITKKDIFAYFNSRQEAEIILKQ
jgi:hypothetical protein